MKRCPECRRDYYDDSLLYCLDDGNALLEGPATASSGDEPATAILSVPPAIAVGLTGATNETDVKTAILQPPAIAGGSDSVRGFDKRLVLAPLVFAVIVLGGFFGYRYITPAKQIESIAVMPFVNESKNEDVEYLSDGMTETLISSLSQLPNLNVKGRSSVFRYKGKGVDTKALGKELGVQAVLYGRVIQRGEQLTLSLELLDAVTENVIWSGKYDRKQADIVSLQSEIARDVSNELKTKLSGADVAKVEKGYTANPEAYRLYLQGRFYWNKRTGPDLLKSIAYFDQAIAIDPAYALAYAGLADAYHVVAKYGTGVKPDEGYAKALYFAQKALDIDPNMAQPHAALGVVFHEYDWKHAEAEKEFKRAIEIDPNYASGHQWYSEYLSNVARSDEAIAEAKRAIEIDPLSPIFYVVLGIAYNTALRYDDAIPQFQKAVEIEPNFKTASFFLAISYHMKGMYEEGVDELQKWGSLSEKDAADLKEAYRRSGERGYWQKRLELFEQNARAGNSGVNQFEMARIQLGLGNKDQALELLEKTIPYSRGDANAFRLKSDPRWAPLKAEPRFKELLRKIGLLE